MTKKTALELAISVLSTDEANTEAVETLAKMLGQVSKPRSLSDEAKAKVNAKRKEATATARAELVAKIAPVLRKYLDTPKTAKELYEVATEELPADFSAAKVQNVLLRELRSELTVTEAKGKPNTYVLA